MLVYIIGKPRNQEELEAIWDHENIVFVDTVDEYRAHRDAHYSGKQITHAIVADIEPAHIVSSRMHRINVGAIGHIGRDKSQLTAILSRMDFAAYAAQEGNTIVLDSVETGLARLLDRVKIDEHMPMPIEYRTRRSKGDKHRNRRHRWS